MDFANSTAPPDGADAIEATRQADGLLPKAEAPVAGTVLLPPDMVRPLPSRIDHRRGRRGGSGRASSGSV